MTIQVKAESRFIAPLVALAALTLAVFLAVFFALTASKAEKTPPRAKPPKVEVLLVSKASRPSVVRGLGTVTAAQSVALQPEVSGVVRTLHPQLIPGGVIKRGEPLLRIDARDYRLAVKAQEAMVSQAEVELRLEQGRQRVAQKEWALLSDARADDGDEELALRKPQLQNAEASLASAQGALEKAQLDLSRTTLRAPFDGFVQSESVDLGQLVGPGGPVVTLVGTEAFWVQVSLPSEQLEYLRGVEGAKARVRANVEREGRVLAQLPDLDPVGKMARILVEISDPLGLATEGAILLGSVAEVEVEGHVLESIYVIPRLALRDNRAVWAVVKNKLKILEVDVVWRGQEEVFVRSDRLDDPAAIVTSRINAPVDGMSVRLHDQAEESR